MRFTILTALIASTAATPAFAQDSQDAAPTFSGFRVEAIAGWDHTEILDDDDGGILYGIGVGYDFRTGGAVLGVEAEVNDSRNNGCIPDFITAGDRFCITSGRDIYVGGRAGVLVSPNVLIYAKAGYTNARYISTYDDDGAGIHDRIGTNLDGVRIGGGAEVGVGRNAFFRLEGRYSNYEAGTDRGSIVGAFGFRF